MFEKAIVFYRKYFKSGPWGWKGDFDNWQTAMDQCEGYNTATILEKVKNAVLKVKNGEAVYERDSVLFDSIEYSWPLLAAILWVAAKNEGKLNVIDFGGSLGSSYFQNKKFLHQLNAVQWNVIEQGNFVTTGRACIQENGLHFYYDMEECITAQGRPNILIISCTLQYVEMPYQLIKQMLAFNIPYLLIDNMPFNDESRDRITIQKVPPAIYNASYPCWFLDYHKVLTAFSEKYSVVSEHRNDSSIELDGRTIQYQGFLLELKK